MTGVVVNLGINSNHNQMTKSKLHSWSQTPARPRPLLSPCSRLLDPRANLPTYLAGLASQCLDLACHLHLTSSNYRTLAVFSHNVVAFTVRSWARGHELFSAKPVSRQCYSPSQVLSCIDRTTTTATCRATTRIICLEFQRLKGGRK